MPDTAKIIEAVNNMHKSVNQSFQKVYIEINGCNGRVTEIETTLAVKKALCKERKEKEKNKTDYWIPVVRAVNIAGILALCALAWGILKDKLTQIWQMVP